MAKGMQPFLSGFFALCKVSKEDAPLIIWKNIHRKISAYDVDTLSFPINGRDRAGHPRWPPAPPSGENFSPGPGAVYRFSPAELQ
jgi:hypothetical protein